LDPHTKKEETSKRKREDRNERHPERIPLPTQAEVSGSTSAAVSEAECRPNEIARDAEGVRVVAARPVLEMGWRYGGHGEAVPVPSFSSTAALRLAAGAGAIAIEGINVGLGAQWRVWRETGAAKDWRRRTRNWGLQATPEP